MKESRAAGFTLIELLVVIAILALLIATFAPDILGARADAQKAADSANLRWHFQQMFRYQQTYKTYPRGSGHQFVLDPWVRGGVVEHTPGNFERYWTPGLKENEPRILELKEIGLEEIWKSQDELTSQDTHYAGPSEEVRKSRKRLDRGTQPLMANDNEFGAAFKDQSVNVLMGDGNVITVLLEDLQKLGYNGDGVDEWFPVNPSSPHPMLQQLDK